MVLAGGIENMTQVPYAVRNIRFGTKFGDDLRVSLCVFLFGFDHGVLLFWIFSKKILNKVT